MKKLILILLLFSSCYKIEELKYSGIIVDKGYEAPTSGYKSNRDPVYFLMMLEDSSKKVIRIDVTIPTWYKLEKGNRTTFSLTNYELYRLGNTDNQNKNLYDK